MSAMRRYSSRSFQRTVDAELVVGELKEWPDRVVIQTPFTPLSLPPSPPSSSPGLFCHKKKLNSPIRGVD